MNDGQGLFQERSPARAAHADKAPDALRTIGEVAQMVGIRQHVLRYWEEQFPMLRPLKRAGGRRYYRPEDIALVQRINQLVHQQGYTIKGARQALRGKESAGVPPSEPVANHSNVASPTPVATPVAMAGIDAETRARLMALRARLAAALQAA